MTQSMLVNDLGKIFLNNTDDSAVIFENSAISYKDLNKRISKLANKLKDFDIKENDYILLSLPRGIDFVVAILASLKTGAFYIPYESSMNSDRLNFIKQDCNVKLTIDENFMADTNAMQETDNSAPALNCGGCVIYTSGSTGHPKGVQITIDSIDKMMRAISQSFQFDKDTKFTYISPFSFVVHLVFNFATLVNGGTLFILNDEDRRNIRKIEEHILKNGITNIFMPPQLYKMFKLQKSTLKEVYIGAEKVVNLKSSGDYKLFNTYGSSETLFTTYFEIDKKYNNTPIGKPLADKEIILVDENNNIAQGEGEICVTGAIFEKYINNNEENEKKFININNKRYFKTNDIAKYDEYDNLIFLNRNDWMIKISGQRIEPTEIEVAIKNYSPDIETVVAKAFQNEYDENYLCCYLKCGNNINTDDLKLWLKNIIPSYMIPSFFIRLDEFKYNENGKIDRNALTPPTLEQYKTEYIAPETDEEKRIVAGFEKVLNIENIGLNDDFFALGGNSIKTVMLLDECDLDLSPADIMNAKTPKNIADLLKDSDKNNIEHFDKQNEYDLTDSEKGIYLEWAQNKNKTAYNLPNYLVFNKNNVSTEQLKNILIDFVNSHSALKSNFINKNGIIKKIRNDEKEAIIKVIKIGDNEIENAKTEFLKPFDLERDDLYRFELCETQNKIYLLFDIHHIVTDGKSVSVMLNYIKDRLLGNTAKSEEIDAYDINIYEQNIKSTEKYKKSKEFFENKFLDKELAKNLESDIYKDSLIGNETECKYILSDELSKDKITSFLNINGLTENSLFMGAFAYCLSKYLNENDITFKTVNDGRFDKKLKNTVGMLVRTLPLEYSIDETVRIKDFLKNVQDDFYKTIKHSDYTYMDFAKNIGIHSDIFFVYQAEMLNGIQLNDDFVELEEIKNDDLISNFNMVVYKKQDKFEIQLKYNNKLYTKAFVENFLNFYNQVLEEFLRKECLKDIELVTSKDKNFIKAFNSKRIPVDSNKTFVDMFKEQVNKTPDNIALIYKENKYTYKELDEITDKLAKYLISKGVKENEYVGVYINRCEFMQISAIAALKAKAAYQPLDPKNPTDRLNFMIKDSNTKFIITSSELKDLIDYKGEMLLTEDILSLGDSDITLPQVNLNDKFVLLYTSGSTGNPKGVELSHKNLANYIVCTKDYINCSEHTKCLAYASFGFDAHMSDFYCVLASGGTVYVASDEMKLNIVDLHNYLLENKINLLLTTTQFLKQYVLMFPDNPYLEYFLAGGEKMPKIQMPKYAIYNLYGPTECTIFSTAYKMESDLHFIPVGTTFGNNTSYIADKYDRLLPIGAIGELYTAGEQVGCGYLNRPDVNKEKFIDNPYDDEFEKLYKTGDNCRYLTDGNIDIIGRKDFQVKIRGFRIELTEIENKILEFKDIKDATVVAYDSPSGGKYIASYIVSDEKIDIAELNNFIKKTLPAYMVPEVTMQIDKIPHNVNGKVDKKKLPEPKRIEKTNTVAQTNELNFLEKTLSQMLKESLGHSDFNITTNFTEAGMTSITAMSFSAMIYKKFNFEIKSTYLLEDCNIFKVENLLQEFLINRKDTPPVIKEASGADEKSCELTQTQMGVYYETLKNPNSLIYNIPLELTLDKNLDVQKLKLSFENVLNNHKVISSYIKQENERVLLIKNDKKAQIEIKEMNEDRYQKFRKSFSKPFDIFKFPLYKGLIVKTENNIYLLFDIHHILFDGISENIFIKELTNEYSDIKAENEKLSFFEFAKQEKELQNSNEYKNSGKFFNSLLKDFEAATELKSDIIEAQKSKLLKYIKPVDTVKVKDFCTKNNFTPAQLFLAACGYAICRFTNTKDIYISTISNGRQKVEFQNTFGMFVKTLPLYVKVENNQSVMNFISNTGKMFRNVIDNEIYPYTKIAKDFGFMPKIMYACQLGVISNNTIAGSEVKIGNLTLETPKFPLSIHVEENKNQEIQLNLQYDSAVYSENIISKLAKAINTALLNMIENSNENIEKISILNSEDEDKLKQFRQTAQKELKIKLLHKLFEKQADLNPDKIALIATDGKYTYKKLEKFSNIIANALIKKGVKVEDKIAILLPRTSGIFKSILGTLKAGAAYIPCDIEYPKERIDKILKDSKAKYIITDSSKKSLYKNSLCIEDLLNNKDDSRPKTDVKPDNLAYMIYTSGSTGNPKGVMIEHKSICNYVTLHKENRHVYGFAKKANIMVSVTTIAFDMAVKEILVPLCNSKTIVFATEEQTKNVIELTKLFKKTHADAFNSTPSRLLQYLEWKDFAKAIAKCKVIICAAENYPINLYRKLKSITKAKLFNTYGPTEITVSSNCAELTGNIKQITVGRPLLNYKEYIVDSDENELPPGVVGQLYVGGIGVSRGYINLANQTNERFINYKGERIYKTGDFAKWTDNGEVVIYGRMDNQVKLRGLRIELDEIQKVICDFGGIKNAAVVVKKINDVENLCAYFEAERKINLDELKESIRRKLPNYMVPSAFVQMDKLPITRNGKVDKKNLPDVKIEKTEGKTDYTNKCEKDFCEIFAKILGLDSVSINDSFFDIGGSSLLATRIIIEAQKLNYNIAYGDIFSAKTPKNLAKLFSTDDTGCENLEISDYDYSKIEQVLKKNTMENFVNNKKLKLGNVLLTGSTGFLGIHVFRELLKSEKGSIYCLIRKGKYEKAIDRLKTLLYYYFEDDFSELLEKRVVLIDGDITNKDSFNKLNKYKINTVINCAANVKHFSEKNDIEEVNYTGVLNIIDYCKKNSINLIHVSTGSIAGISIGDIPPKDAKLTENVLYFNQKISGKYVTSKFKAERAVLEAISQGLTAKIMRVGNLAARDKDGEFQINFNTNAFVGRLKVYKLIKKFPYDMVNAKVEFSPIDNVAKAIVLLARAPKECCVFHPYNSHITLMGDIIAQMQIRGMNIKFVEDDEFQKAYTKARNNKKNAKTLSSLIAYQNMGHGKSFRFIEKSNDYTVRALFRLGFMWPITSKDYMDRFFKALEGLRFFDN